MQHNVGGADRTLRFVAGVLIMGLGIYFASWWGLVGLVLFLTALFKRCFAYNLLGISTCPLQKETSDTTPKV